MVAPIPAPMDKCDPKCRCPDGPYANQAFSCDSPCVEGCEFSCEAGCDCGANYIWVVDFYRQDGDSGSAGCFVENCEPAETTAFDQVVISFDNTKTLVKPLNSVNYCSISEVCPHGPQNCGTWREATGADVILFGGGYIGSMDAVCGLSDLLMQNFISVEGTSYPPGTIISAFVHSHRSGAIGCCFEQSGVISVRPYEP